MIGTLVSHYRVLEELGAGGMGVVYLANDEQLSRKVALKFISPAVAGDETARARLLREARTASALDHPNVETVYEVGEWNGRVFLAMGYYPGETLKQRIARGPLGIDEAASIVEQIANGLAAAHAAGIVHRDLKPANVMLTSRGAPASGDVRVKILDFGLAKLVGPSVETAADVTGLGTTLGTLSYMAPEQARGEYVDQRADIWALGVVLFEMLTGQRPFRGDTAAAVLTAVASQPLPAVKSLRPDTPPELEGLVERALVRDPAGRTLTAEQAAGAIARYRARAAKRLARRPIRWVAIPAAIALLVAIGFATRWALGSGNRRWATSTALPEIRRLVAAGDNTAAFDLAVEAERYVPAHPDLVQLLPSISRRISIRSQPEGADVSYMPYGSTGTWRRIGPTPLTDVRLPWGWLRVKVEKAGFDAREDLVANFVGQGMMTGATFVLASSGTNPSGMVRTSPTPSPFSVYVLSLELPRVSLNAFWIDQHEVTNRDYKAFVDAGGYRRAEFWRHPFIRDGKTLAWEDAMAWLRDATGQPGPHGWELGSYVPGQEDFPVTGVSWYEAAAYAAFAGKRLPTLYHWAWVASQPLTGFVIPFANFNARAPVRADSSAALHRFGAVNLAGNVKEWSFNESSGGKRYVMGGGFDDPPYMFSDADARAPFDRASNFGFRCVKLDPEDTSFAALSGAIPGPSRDYARESPVSDAVFAAYTRLFSYDRTDLKAAIERTDDTNADWRVEHVTFAAAYAEERVIAYLFLPKAAKPPYQTVVYMPPANAWDSRSSAALLANPQFSYLVRSGRAVMFPIYKGTYERGTDDFRSDSPKSTSRWRDHVIALSKDLNRSVDYLISRPDIDHARIGYLGTSRGAAIAPMLLAMQPRISVAALWLPGLYLEPVLPEVDAIHFAPRVKIPTLALSGRYDYNFRDETSSRPFFDLLGTTTQQKRRVVYETGHNLPTNDAIKHTLEWFDVYFGPAR